MRDVAYVALGSNLGHRERMLEIARESLRTLPDSRVIGESSIEETAPIGPISQPAFLNQMIAIETELAPRELLNHLHDIERRAGRVRAERWGPRTLDLDIVCFDLQTIDEPDLAVPHRELVNRDFWQRELDELRAMPRGGGDR